ncbi:endo-1,4-beta-xylanase [uncultured Winogradskyella sp.]|uniref:endo-1,4-beta-xylanase n=1 Tax=uncultured Winogradskyella sp. TaxID=395353 RepID=UPI00261AA998|nr:endo-1,4-beta-xylanase [uncultured Winogradskyella sp.]
MKNLMKHSYSYILLMAIVTFFACQTEDDGGGNAATTIVPSFELTISEQNPLTINVVNTSTGANGLTSFWQFRQGGPLQQDVSGSATHTYGASGEYQVSLIIQGPNGNVEISDTVIVDDGVVVTPPVANLKDATNSFSIGMAVQASRLTDEHDEILKSDFNNLTAEFEMKMNIMYPSQGTYDFTAADAIVNYGVANDMDIHGHTLIWHNSVPDWVENFTGTDEEFETMIEDYITTVVTRYSGTIRSWDVVNEAIEDNTGALRNSVFRTRMGDDYIAKCYQFARNADPNILLFYNDYNITFDTNKQATMFSIVDDLMAQGLIDGVGAQMHIDIYFPSASQIQSVVNGTVSRGLKMHFSELDVRVNPGNDISQLTEARAIEQRNKVREVVEIYDAIPNQNKFALTVWGLRDSETWLVDFWGQPDWPLLYNNDFTTKPAHDGFIEALSN